MGDTGSLALGGALGTVAILLKAEFLLLLIGGVFVAEAMSVMIQTGTYKWYKRTRGREYADTTGCSAWRRCTTTSRSSAGPKRPWSRDSHSRAVLRARGALDPEGALTCRRPKLFTRWRAERARDRGGRAGEERRRGNAAAPALGTFRSMRPTADAARCSTSGRSAARDRRGGGRRRARPRHPGLLLVHAAHIRPAGTRPSRPASSDSFSGRPIAYTSTRPSSRLRT